MEAKVGVRQNKNIQMSAPDEMSSSLIWTGEAIGDFRIYVADVVAGQGCCLCCLVLFAVV